MKLSLVILMFILFSCVEENSTASINYEPDRRPSFQDSASQIKGPEVGVDTIKYDTINGIVLRRLEQVKIYTGEMRDYLYVFNGVYTYGLTSDWQSVFPIEASQFDSSEAMNASTEVDTFGLPVKNSANLSLTDSISFEDDTNEDHLAIYQYYGYFFNRQVLVFSKLGLHKKIYYSVNLATNQLDTLGGKPIQFGDYLLCADLELATDSQHEISIINFLEGHLHSSHKFSLGFYFGIRPEKVFMAEDSLLFVKEMQKEKYWKIAYRNLE